MKLRREYLALADQHQCGAGSCHLISDETGQHCLLRMLVDKVKDQQKTIQIMTRTKKTLDERIKSLEQLIIDESDDLDEIGAALQGDPWQTHQHQVNVVAAPATGDFTPNPSGRLVNSFTGRTDPTKRAEEGDLYYNEVNGGIWVYTNSNNWLLVGRSISRLNPHTKRVFDHNASFGMPTNVGEHGDTYWDLQLHEPWWNDKGQWVRMSTSGCRVIWPTS